MHYKTKSALTLAVLAAFMIGVSVFINNLEGAITGAAVGPACACGADVDCDDGNVCTEDICLYADDCAAAV